MRSFALLIVEILNIYKWILIASVVVSWLISFNVINTYNRFVATISDVLYRLTEPVLRPIRQYVPSIGGIDISPVIALLAVWFLQMLVMEYLF
jgi:YggT family protein